MARKGSLPTKDFIAYQIALQAVRNLAGCLGSIGRKDRNLEQQLRRAAQSIVLNLGEGNCWRGQDRLHFFRIAAGSAAEVLAGLDIAMAWGYLSEATAEPARQLLDRLLASPSGDLLAAHRAECVRE